MFATRKPLVLRPSAGSALPTPVADDDPLVTVRQVVVPVLPGDVAGTDPPGPGCGTPPPDRRWIDTAIDFTIAPGSRRPDPTAPTEPSPNAVRMPQVGDRFLGFELVEKLGHGSFAHVFLARQPDLADRPVVLKVSADSRSESRALAQLQHPNIVPIYSVHQSGRLSALCMPYLGSTTLADGYRDLGAGQPERRPADPGSPARRMIERFGYTEAILGLAAQLADGLAHALARGILHRDLKPSNILLTDEGVPILFDFNLAAETRSREPTSPGAGGTLPYMSPEQLRAFAGGPSVIDARTDLYAVGVILFELLTRSHPFTVYRPFGRDTLARMLRDRCGPPPRLRPGNPHVSPAVEAIVRKCLEPDPRDRYQSARDLKEDLDRQLRHLPLRHAPDASVRERLWKWRRRNPSLASRVSFWILCAAATVALIFGYAHLDRERSRTQAVPTGQVAGNEHSPGDDRSR